MKLLFLDLETTGFDTQFNYIIEVAGVVYDTKLKKEIATFHEYAKPAVGDIPLHITQLTGITNEQVEDCDYEREVLQRFFEFIVEHQPERYVGHNIDTFDLRWLREKSDFLGLGMPIRPTVDTLKWAKEANAPTALFTKTGRPSFRQESIAQALNIEYEAHSAIEDVRALIKIFHHLNKLQPLEDKATIIERKRRMLGF